MPKVTTPKQKRFLFSSGSPLTQQQKKRFASELRSGKVKTRRRSRRKRRK